MQYSNQFGKNNPRLLIPSPSIAHAKMEGATDQMVESDLPPQSMLLSTRKRTFIQDFLNNLEPASRFPSPSPPEHHDDHSQHHFNHQYSEKNIQSSLFIKSRTCRVPLTFQVLTEYSVRNAMSPPKAFSELTHPMPTVTESPISKKQKTGPKTIGPDDVAFTNQLMFRHVKTSENKSDLPSNWDEILDFLKTERSPMPELKTIDTWSEVACRATSEATIKNLLLSPILDILVPIAENRLVAAGDAMWTRESPLDSDVSFYTNAITPPKPDLTIGFDFSDFVPLLSGPELLTLDANWITPVISDPRLAFPCFTLETKGFNSPDFARQQNLHNAAVMLRNLRSVHGAHSSMSGFDKTAHVLSVNMNKHGFELSAHWTDIELSDSEHRGGVFYHWRSIGNWKYNNSTDFQSGVQCIRNAIDWTLEHNRPLIVSSLKKDPDQSSWPAAATFAIWA
jgi:hypothetical protein